MLQASPELIQRAIAIIGRDGISEEHMEALVLDLTQDSMLARRLIDWLPEAFAMVFIPHLATVNLPTTFSARTRSGKWMEFEFQAEPIFAAAVRIGMDMYHSGPKNTFKNVVVRSSIVDAVNKALNDNVSIHGATLSGPALIGIPAETYLSKPKSLWGRLFQ
jgi:hypothetical protein